MYIGIDLNDNGSRIAYMMDGDEPVVLSPITGSEQYMIPSAAALDSKGEWIFGDKALKQQEEGGEAIESLFANALKGTAVNYGGQQFSSFKILLKYVEYMLALTTLTAAWSSASYIVFSIENLDAPAVELTRKIMEALDYPSQKMGIISRHESYYEYIHNQKGEIWLHDVLVLDCSKEGVIASLLNIDRRTKPAVCTVTDEIATEAEAKNDKVLSRFCKWVIEGRIVSSVFVVGEAIDPAAIPETLRYLKSKRNIYRGYPIYPGGACYAAKKRAAGMQAEIGDILFLGKNKLRYNIGLKAFENREEHYISLMDAGVNWHEVYAQTEAYLGKERELRIVLSPITRSKSEYNALVRLSDIPMRADHATRVKIELEMKSDTVLQVKVTDLGFGQIFPSSGAVVVEQIKLEM